MLGINQAKFSLPQNITNNNQSQPQFKLKTLNKDTVSFKARYVSDAVMESVKKAEQETQRSFFIKLRELCERAENSDLAGKVDADAQILKGKHAERAKSLLDLIHNDSGTDYYFKQVIRDLKESVGNPLII